MKYNTARNRKRLINKLNVELNHLRTYSSFKQPFSKRIRILKDGSRMPGSTCISIL